MITLFEEYIPLVNGNTNIIELPRTVLKVVPSGEDRYYLTTFNTGVFTLKLRLPSNIWCDQCILQWTYTVRKP